MSGHRRWVPASGSDDDIGALHGMIDRLSDALHIIPDGDRAVDVHTHAAQSPRDIARIRVNNFT